MMLLSTIGSIYACLSCADKHIDGYFMILAAMQQQHLRFPSIRAQTPPWSINPLNSCIFASIHINGYLFGSGPKRICQFIYSQITDRGGTLDGLYW